MTLLCPLGLLSFALLLSGSTASWISVQLSSGAWVAVFEASRGRFLLHPRALVERVTVADCASNSPTALHVRFWLQRDLRSTELALREQRLCDPAGPCRVEPFQGHRLALRDQRGLWRPLQPRRFLPVTLPPVMRFAISRTKNESCPQPVIRDLTGLILEIRKVVDGLRNDVTVELDLSRLSRSNDTDAEWRINTTSVEMQQPDEVTLLQAKVNRLQYENNRLQTQLLMRKKAGNSVVSQKTLPPLKRLLNGLGNITDCLDVKVRGLKGGVYYLDPLARSVVCTVTGRMVVLARESGSLDFNRNWANYRQGFGDLTESDFFLGLAAMHKYTSQGDKCLTLTLETMNESLPLRSGQYSQFAVGPESSSFSLTYKKYKGNFFMNMLDHHKGANFYTPDRDNKQNCGKYFESGNWFVGCFHVNVFGRFNHTGGADSGMSSRGMSKQFPDSYYPLRSVFMTLHKPGGDPQALTTLYNIDSPSCPSRVLEWTAPETAEYLITAGGAPGGAAPHGNSPSGGRGALVKMRTLLKKGSKLRLIVGCRGGVGHLSGGGGDATFVADMTRQVLLVAAGGGGGGGWVSGGPGRASGNGGKALLAPGVREDVVQVAATGWHSVKAKIFGSLNGVASSGGTTISDQSSECRGGGGGGGFNGGWGAADGGLRGERRSPRHSAGGGGGSACNEKFAESCEMEEGGNERGHGVLKIEEYRCF